MFVVQMLLASVAWVAAIVITVQTIAEDDNPQVQSRKLMVAAILLAIVVYLIK
jgi:hypothetical protein